MTLEVVPPPGYKSPYRHITRYLDYRSTLPRTKTERLDDLHTALNARIGQRGLDNMFGDRGTNHAVIHRSGRLRLPIDTPGLKMSVHFVTSGYES